VTPLLLAGVALAGGVGAVVRFVLDGVLRARTRAALPVGTIAINLSGSLLLGLVVGATGAHLLPDAARAVLGTGFLGGYTTFSASTIETLRLLEQRRIGLGLVNALGLLVAATALAGVGLAVGAAL
jgi:CrcB protein